MKDIRNFTRIALMIACGIQITSCTLVPPTKKMFKGTVNLSSFTTPGYGTVGIQNVDQLMNSMTAVTNLPPTTMIATSTGGQQSIAQTYSNISPFLSANGNIATVNSAMLLAITGFAGSVCSAWLSKEAAAEIARAGSSMADSGVNFNAGPTGINQSVATQVVNNYAKLFWGRAPTADELSILTKGITDSAVQVTDPGSQGAQEVLLVPCTIMLASPRFLAA